jgi:hypothetical protein
MTVSAFVERPSPEPKRFSNTELLEIFADCKRKHGDDLGLMFMSLNLELEYRIAELELRLAKLEAKRK